MTRTLTTRQLLRAKKQLQARFFTIGINPPLKSGNIKDVRISYESLLNMTVTDVKKVVVQVCDTLNITVGDFYSSRRDRYICDSRKIVCLICIGRMNKVRYKDDLMGCQMVGKAINKNHATVLFNYKEGLNLMGSSEQFRLKFEECKLICAGNSLLRK